MARQSAKPTLEAIQAELADANYKVRKEAIRKLMRYQRKEAVEPLLALLQDGRGDVRAKAVQALGKLADMRAFLSVLALLTDKNASVRAQVVRALGNFSDRSVVRPLVDLLNDPKPQIRQYSARSLGKLRDLNALPALLAYLTRVKAESDITELYHAARAVGDLGVPAVIEPLLALCDRPSSFSVHYIVADVLSQQRENTFPLLLKVLEDETRSPQVRACVAQALATNPRPECLQALIAVLDDRHGSVREHAARSLGTLKDPAAIEPLMRLLDDEVELVQVVAVHSLATLKASRAVERLIALLSTELQRDYPSSQLIRGVASALGELGDTRAAMPLLEIFWRVDGPSYCVEAALALCKLNDPVIIEPMLERLPGCTRANRWHAVQIMGHFGDPRAVEPLLAFLDVQATKYFDLRFQDHLIETLGKLGDPRAIEPLRKHRPQAFGVIQCTIDRVLAALESAQQPV